eukprot:1798118-Ditylum_brightwellii.AAC.1
MAKPVDERLEQRLQKQEEAVKNQLDRHNAENLNNFAIQDTKMDQKFEKMEALLITIQGKLESNNRVADTTMETLSTVARALQKCSSSQQSSIQILQEN